MTGPAVDGRTGSDVVIGGPNGFAVMTGQDTVHWAGMTEDTGVIRSGRAPAVSEVQKIVRGMAVRTGVPVAKSEVPILAAIQVDPIIGDIAGTGVDTGIVVVAVIGNSSAGAFRILAVAVGVRPC